MIPEILFDEGRIARRVREIGAEVARAMAGVEVCVVGRVKGCMMFMPDLVRAIPLEMSCHFLHVTTLHDEAGDGPPRTDIVYSTETTWEGTSFCWTTWWIPGLP